MKKVYSCRVGTRSANGCFPDICYNERFNRTLRKEVLNHIWAINFVHDKLSNGHSYKMLAVLDEYTREALCVAVRPKMNAHNVLDALHPLLMKHGKPEFIRPDNGPEFISMRLQDWLKKVGIKPCKSIQAALGNLEGLENSVGHCFPDTWYNERFNGTLRKEVLNAEWFHTTR